MSVEVPKWKKDLIRKKQMWKSQGGWSVPPHPVCTTPRDMKPNVRPPQNVSANSDRKTLKLDAFSPQNGPFCKLSDSPKNRPTPRTDALDLADGEIFGSVSDLKAIFQPPRDDFPPMVKSLSVENILDEKPMLDNSRRASTSNDFTQNPEFPKKFRAVPSMEDFFKKYRKVPPKKTPAVLDLPKNAHPDKTGRKDKTVYFVDMNKSELPTPNTVKKTVRVFEDPQNPEETQFDKFPDVPEDITYKTRDVVQKFEAKIKSQPENDLKHKKQHSLPKIGVRKTEKSANYDPPADFHSSPTDRAFDKNGNFSPTRIFNVVLSSDSTVVANGLNSPTDEKMSDLKTVTISTNQSIVIKTI